MKFKKGLFNYLKLVIWFQLMVFYALFNSRLAKKVLLAYVESEKKRVNDRVDKLHNRG